MYKENVIFNVPVTNNFLLFLLILAIMTSPRPPPSPQHPSTPTRSPTLGFTNLAEQMKQARMFRLMCSARREKLPESALRSVSLLLLVLTPSDTPPCSSSDSVATETLSSAWVLTAACRKLLSWAVSCWSAGCRTLLSWTVSCRSAQ